VLVKFIPLSSECSYFHTSRHHGKNIAKSFVKKNPLVSTVPCKRTVYRMVENAESRAHYWSTYETRNLRSQMRLVYVNSERTQAT
jgi:hypothetical protein